MPLSAFGRTFRPAALGFALALAACAAGIALGNWQASRAAEKRAASDRFDAALRGSAVELPPRVVDAADYVARRVAAQGIFLAEHTILLEHKLRRGRLGYEVVTPLRLSGERMHVLVNRGWIAAGSRRDDLPEVRTPSGEQRIEGYALERLPQALAAPGAPDRGRVRQNLRIEDFHAETGLALQPIVIEQLSESDDGLARDWPRPDSGAEKHEMYALQWYSLAVLAVVLFISLSFRRDPPASE